MLAESSAVSFLFLFFFPPVKFSLQGKIMVEAAHWESSADVKAPYCCAHDFWVNRAICVCHLITGDILVMQVRVTNTKIGFPLFIFPIWREWRNEVNSSV